MNGHLGRWVTSETPLPRIFSTTPSNQPPPPPAMISHYSLSYLSCSDVSFAHTLQFIKGGVCAIGEHFSSTRHPVQWTIINATVGWTWTTLTKLHNSRRGIFMPHLLLYIFLYIPSSVKNIVLSSPVQIFLVRYFIAPTATHSVLPITMAWKEKSVFSYPQQTISVPSRILIFILKGRALQTERQLQSPQELEGNGGVLHIKLQISRIEIQS